MLFYNVKFSLFSSLFLLIINSSNVVCGERRSRRQDPSRLINCGIDYLPETIGISMVNNQIYQILLIKETIQMIVYDNKHQRIKGRSTKQQHNNDDDNKNHNYKMDFTNGYLYQFDEIIINEYVREQIYETLHYEQKEDNENEEFIFKKQISKHMNSIIIINSNNNHIQFLTYETKYSINHLVFIFDEEISENKIIKSFKIHRNLDKMILVSDGEQNTLLISHIMNDTMFSIETIKGKDNLYFLYISSPKPNEFISTKIRGGLQLPIYSRLKLEEIFGQYDYRYGFIQKFLFFNNDDGSSNGEKIEENILFLFSNNFKKILTFNVGDIFSNEIYIPYFLLNYQDFFHCNNKDNVKSTDHPDNNNNNNDDVTEAKQNPEITTEQQQENPDQESLSAVYILIIIGILIIVCPLLAIITMICYQKCFCQTNKSMDFNYSQKPLQPQDIQKLSRKQSRKLQLLRQQELQELRKLQDIPEMIRISKRQRQRQQPQPYKLKNLISDTIDSKEKFESIADTTTTTTKTESSTSTSAKPKIYKI